MSTWLKNALQYTFGIGLGVGLLYLAFAGVNWDTFRSQLQGAHYEWLIGILLFTGLAHFLRGLRWALMLKASGSPVSGVNAFWAVMVGYMTNCAVPRLGEITRCSILKRSDNVPLTSAFGTVVAERAIDLFVLVGMMLLLLLVEFDRLITVLERFFPAKGLMLLIGVAILGLLGLAMAWVMRARLSRLPLLSKAYSFIEQLIEAALSLRHLKQRWLFSFYTVGIWFCYVMCNFLAFQVVDSMQGFSFYFAFVLMMFSALAMIVPVPGGLGSAHHAYILTFLAFGLSDDMGRLFAILAHTPGFLFSIVVGAIGYFVLIFRKPAIAQTLTN